MRNKGFRKIASLALAAVVIAGLLFAPAAVAGIAPESGAASKYTAYADEYMWLNVRSTAGLTAMQSSTKEIVLKVENTRDGNFTFDEATLEFENNCCS